MWFGVLGALVVRDTAGQPITVGGPARRLLLAALISRVGQTVAPDVLIEDIWGAVPPRSAIGTLRSHVVRLRADLGREEADRVLVTDRTGYRLQVSTSDVDATAFADAVVDATGIEDGEQALERIDAALTMWRGDPYLEFPDAAFCVAERVRLVELRELAEERRTDLALGLGQAAELIAGLEKRVAAAPYRERGWEQLMLALYRSGRQAEALGAFRRASERLVEDLGVDPGAGLRALEERILRQDPELLLPTASPVRVEAPRVVQPDRCPYRGLASYGDADGDVFVGRERLTGQIVGRIAEHRVVVVAGASGTGKSSVLRAGVIPALRRGALPGSAAWRTAVLTPAQVTRAGLGALDLVVLDQGEELFSQLDLEARAAAVDALELFAESGGRVVLALRADFYGRLADVQPFGAYAQAATVLVGPLRPDELRRVIVEPAQRVGLTCEPELVEAVLDDVGAAPAALPLLSAALVRVWHNRAGSVLTLDGYRRSGGVASAIEDTAEEAYAALDEQDRVAARRLLVRLAALEGETWVRRPVRRADAGLDRAGERAVGVLAAARLVSVSTDRIELTHETLLEHWPRLRTWLAERALAADLLSHLSSTAAAWRASGRPDSDLYRGARLQAAIDWREQHPEDVAPSEDEFLTASWAAAQRELQEARERAETEARGRRRLRSVVAVLAVVVALAAAATVVALVERSNARRSASAAERAALAADARRLAALSVTAPDIATSSLLAVAAYKLQDSADTRGALLSAVERNQSALWRIQTPRRPQRLLVTSDGARAVVSDNNRTAYVYDTRRRRELVHFPIAGQWVEAMTPDAQNLLTFGQARSDLNPTGRVRVYDAATGTQVRILTTGLDPNGPDPISSSDNRWLAGFTPALRGQAGVDIWRLGDLSAAPLHFGVPASPQAYAVSRDAIAVENLDGSVVVRALPSLRLIGRLPRTAHQLAPGTGLVAVSPDGKLVLRGEPDDTSRAAIYRVGTASGAPVAPVPLPTQPQSIFQVDFSPDGKLVALGDATGTMAVYRTNDGGLDEALSGHAGPVLSIRWTGSSQPTGLYSIGLDSQIVSWTIQASTRLVRFSGPTVPSLDRGEVFGRYVLGFTPKFGQVPSPKENLYLVNLDTGSLAVWPALLKGGSDPFAGEYANQAVASHDGRWALVSINDQTGFNHIDVWDLVHHLRTGALHLPGTAFRHLQLGLTAAITPDGKTAYASVDRNHLGVFALPSGQLTRTFSLAFPNPDANRILDIPWQFDPKGRLLVVGYDSGPYIKGNPLTFPTSSNDPIDHRFGLLDVRTGRWLTVRHLGDVNPRNIAWSPDGRTLALGTVEGTLTTYDATTLHERSAAGPVEPGLVLTVSYSPDGRTIVTGGTSGYVSFYDASDLSREGNRLPVGASANNGGVYAWYDHAGDVVGFANDPTHPDGQRWFTLPADPAALVRTACALAGADITRAQWTRYVGDRPYRSVCADSS